MRYYFHLQFRMLNRHLTDFGLHPLAGYGISLLAFVALSYYLFLKTELAPYVYVLVALSLVLRLNEEQRNSFLRNCFPKNTYHLIRIMENFIVTLPFACFLVYQHSFLMCLVLFSSAILLAFSGVSYHYSFTIPTPFYKKPWEFIVGFRNTFYLILLAIILTIISVSVENFNLGIFSLLLVFLVAISFYSNPEIDYFVWIFNLSPGQFLFEKIKTALLFSTLLSLPVITVLLIFGFSNAPLILAFQGLGYSFLATMILAKYSRFPGQAGLPEMFIMAMSLWFPPLLLLVIPYFYLKSVKRLKEILK